MAMQTAGDLRALLDDELVTRLREAKEELFNLRFQSATGQLDNNARLRTVKKDTELIYTVMPEREPGRTTERAATTSEAAKDPTKSDHEHCGDDRRPGLPQSPRGLRARP